MVLFSAALVVLLPALGLILWIGSAAENVSSNEVGGFGWTVIWIPLAIFFVWGILKLRKRRILKNQGTVAEKQPPSTSRDHWQHSPVFRVILLVLAVCTTALIIVNLPEDSAPRGILGIDLTHPNRATNSVLSESKKLLRKQRTEAMAAIDVETAQRLSEVNEKLARRETLTQSEKVLLANEIGNATFWGRFWNWNDMATRDLERYGNQFFVLWGTVLVIGVLMLYLTGKFLQSLFRKKTTT